MATLEPIATQRNVRIACTNCPPLSVKLPEQAVRQILLNVIRNAIEATDAGASEVEIDVKQEAIDAVPSVVIAISDRGAGIDAAIRDEIFEPFVTTEGATPSSGLGLGLSIAKSLSLAMGGKIEFDARSGGGTVFRITLPTVLAEREKDRP